MAGAGTGSTHTDVISQLVTIPAGSHTSAIARQVFSPLKGHSQDHEPTYLSIETADVDKESLGLAKQADQ